MVYTYVSDPDWRGQSTFSTSINNTVIRSHVLSGNDPVADYSWNHSRKSLQPSLFHSHASHANHRNATMTFAWRRGIASRSGPEKNARHFASPLFACHHRRTASWFHPQHRGRLIIADSKLTVFPPDLPPSIDIVGASFQCEHRLVDQTSGDQLIFY